MIYRLLVQNYSTIIAVAASNASLHLGFWNNRIISEVYIPDKRGSWQSQRRGSVASPVMIRADWKKNAGEILSRYLDFETIDGFLKWVEAERGCSISTRNLRLPDPEKRLGFRARFF
jgi:hypothetical protein